MILSIEQTRSDSCSDKTTLKRKLSGLAAACVALGGSLIATPVSAQDRRVLIFGEVGGASIGHADSLQGRAPIVGGGVAFDLTPRLVIEGDVHGGRVEHVFGREHHNFTQVTITGSLLFRAPVGRRGHVVAGGGLALQRAHTEFDEPRLGRVDKVETLNLVHGRIGADWDASSRLVILTSAVLWIGGGLDWVAGARIGLGYRF
jgi:hypothetical protein